MTVKKTGGLWFWKIGRIGGSVYVTKPRYSDKPSRFGYLKGDFAIACMALPIGWLIGSIYL
jgi:hypothetical protein